MMLLCVYSLVSKKYYAHFGTTLEKFWDKANSYSEIKTVVHYSIF